MKLLLLTFAIMATAFLALSLGVILTGKALKGSCGGKALCLFCKKRDDCKESSKNPL